MPIFTPHRRTHATTVDRTGWPRCPHCKYDHRGVGILCDVCAKKLSRKEQTRYIETASDGEHPPGTEWDNPPPLPTVGDASWTEGDNPPALAAVIGHAAMPIEASSVPAGPPHALDAAPGGTTASLNTSVDAVVPLAPPTLPREVCAVLDTPDASLRPDAVRDASSATPPRGTESDNLLTLADILNRGGTAYNLMGIPRWDEREHGAQQGHAISPETSLTPAPPASLATPGPHVPCKICRHPAIETINAGLLNDTLTLTAAHKTYRVHRTLLSRHRHVCLGLPRMSKTEAAHKAVQALRQRPRRCIVCRHPDRARIDAELTQGISCLTLILRYAGTEHHFSDHSASLHRRACLGLSGVRGRRAHDADADISVAGEMPPVLDPFAAHVDAELRRLIEDRTRLMVTQVALVDQLVCIERQQTALRMWQEANREAS